MKVTSENHDEVSAIITVTVNKADYKAKVEKTLMNYAKNAQIPGFRKGKAPLSMIKRQYEEGISYEEINKLVSDSLNQYITDNKLRILGQPIPVPVDHLDLNSEELDVKFDIGFEPEFELDLANYTTDYFKVEAGDKEIQTSIENMQKRFGERLTQDQAAENSYIQVSVSPICEQEEHQHEPKQVVLSSETKEGFDLLKSKKVGESLVVSKKEVQDHEELAKHLNLVNEAQHSLHDEFKVEVTDVYNITLAELNQELFDKVYGKDVITNEDDLKMRVKKELNDYFQQNADVHFVNTFLENVLDKIEFALPETFLGKWLMFNNPNIPNADEAMKVLENEKRTIRYQIIEGKLMSDYDVKLEFSDITSHAEDMVRNQLMMYGLHDIGDDEVKKYAVEMLKNEEQIKQISAEVNQIKIKDLILDKASKNEVSISHDEFLDKLKK